MPKFKVGDRVVRLFPWQGIYNGIKEGSIGSVVAISKYRENMVRVSFDDIPDPESVVGWGMYEETLELCSPPVQIMRKLLNIEHNST